MSLVLDASVVLAWALEDETSWYADAVQDALGSGQTAVAPCHWALEVASGLLAAERRQRIDRATVESFLENLECVPIETEEPGLRAARTSILDLARAGSLAPYDAAYLELALQRREPLATLDDLLAAAAGRSGVQLWRPPRDRTRR